GSQVPEILVGVWDLTHLTGLLIYCSYLAYSSHYSSSYSAVPYYCWSTSLQFYNYSAVPYLLSCTLLLSSAQSAYLLSFLPLHI
ncbi:hypothetical protein DL96DRAFT_1602940, partial [Flagelloscypha sp. PMI_526]